MIKEAQKKTPRPIIMLAPVFWHILSKPDLAKYEPRIEMTQKGLDHLLAELKAEGITVDPSDVVVSRIDEDAYNASQVTGTLPVLKFMIDNKEKYDIDPNDISLVLGNDTYEDILGGVWNKAEEILGLCKNVYVFDRDNKPVLDPMAAVEKAETFCQSKPAEGFIATRIARLPAVKAKVASLPDDYFVIQKGAVREEYRTTSSTGIRNNYETAKQGVAVAVLEYMEQHPWTYQCTDHLVGIFVPHDDISANTSATLRFLRNQDGCTNDSRDNKSVEHVDKKRRID
jgi:hypothetical protein